MDELEGRYLLGLKLSRRLEEWETVDPALFKARDRLAQLGVVVEGWEYDQPENLLLVLLRCGSEALAKARAIIADSLSEELKLSSTQVALGPHGFVGVVEALPSSTVLGFLLRASAEVVGYNGLSGGEALALLIHYACNCDRAKTLITASYLGVDPCEIDETLDRLAAKGYIEGGGLRLTEEGERLLDGLISELRVKPSARGEHVQVVDERGGLERFSFDKLASSLHGCGVPHSVVPIVLEHVERVLRGKRYISRRLLAMLTRSLLDEVLPVAGAAERFHYYVYALDKLFVESEGAVRRLSWELLRRVCRGVLSERGPKPPRSLVQQHAELLVTELRELAAAAPWRFEGRVLTLDEVKSVGRYVAPKASFAWLDLAVATPEEVSARYWSLGRSYLEASARSLDCGDRKELIYRATLLLSSSVLLKLGLLPSNSVELNVGVVRAEANKSRERDETRLALLTLCKLIVRLIRSPAMVGPSEHRRVSRALSEMLELIERLSPPS